MFILVLAVVVIKVMLCVWYSVLAVETDSFLFPERKQNIAHNLCGVIAAMKLKDAYSLEGKL